MNRNIAIGFCLACVLICTVGALRVQHDGIFITGGFGGEPKLQSTQPDQVADWIWFQSNGVSIFELPPSGIVPIAYGGTGVATLAQLQALVTNAPTSGITLIANGGTSTNTLAGITTLSLNAGMTGTNDTTWFDAKGAAKALTNGAANVGVYVVFTGTNGVLFTNRIINGVIQ